MKKIFAIALTLCMVLSLCACGESSTLKTDILGTWTTPSYFTQEEAEALLADFGFVAKEYSFTDMTALQWVDTVTFTADGKFTFQYDAAATEEIFKTVLDGMMSDIYAHLDDMEDVYGVTSADFESEAEFKDAYAQLVYEKDDYNTFLNDIVSNMLYNYYDFSNTIYDDGTYEVTKDGIEMTSTGETTAYLCGAAVEGDVLTLTFASGDVQYTKK